MKIEHGETRLGDVKRNFSDTSKADKIMYCQAHVGLEEGIKQTIEWFFKKDF